MFESAELGHKIDKEVFKVEEPKLRSQLLEMQFKVNELKKFPVIILISGVDGSGKGETINQLYEWMDARYLSTFAFSSPTEEERERPYMWRYWRALPPKGRIGIFSGSWYSTPIHDRLMKISSKSDFENRVDSINRFERMMVNENALILKFWFHLSKSAQKKRLQKLEKDPCNAWRVTKDSWKRLDKYDEFQVVASQILRSTSTPWASWTIVEGTDDRYRHLTVGKFIYDSIMHKVANKKTSTGVITGNLLTPNVQEISNKISDIDVLSNLNLNLKLPKEEYIKKLPHYQGELSELVRSSKFKKLSAVLVFEGSDAAGKGGAVRRLASSMDARQYQIIPIAAPTEEEKAQPYLWRFWKHLPRDGRLTIFDRSWYGRVLVERIEKFCSESDWQRAYSEINDFEEEIAASHTIIIKFWLQISKEEQLRRFKEREKITFKQFKITEEDWRNRKKWDEYHKAVCDMVEHTSTRLSPWTLVEAEDKNYARVKILKTVCDRIKKELK